MIAAAPIALANLGARLSGSDVLLPWLSDAEAALAGFMDGSFSIYSGPMMDNAGNMVIEAGTTHGATDLWLEGMAWMVDGVTGSTGA